MDDMPGQSKKSTEKGVSHRAGNSIEPVVRQIEKPAVNVIKIGAGETALEEARQNAVEQNNSVPEARLPAITQSETVPSVVLLKNTRSVKEKSQHKLAAPRQSKFAGGQVKVAEKVSGNISSTFTSSQKTDLSGRVIDKPDAVANIPPKESLSKVKVAADILNLRILPDLQRAVVARLEKGTVLKVIGLEKAWLQVETSDGRTGWVAGHLTTDLRTGRRAQAPL
ncbi:MAG: SH3 domain-containing protein [Desulfobacterales bacterium]|nr:SH3 domain-containing protein [Desulfobacterales bacterium]